MAHTDPTYVIFDADNDMWAYQYMRGWGANKNIPFSFHNVHDLKPLREDAYLEPTVKTRLRERFAITKQVIVLIGDHTRYLYMFVKWEIETALDLDLPIIAVNLNNKRVCDPDLCPPVLRGKRVIHIPFRARIIKHAMDTFPAIYRDAAHHSSIDMYYFDEVYKQLGVI